MLKNLILVYTFISMINFSKNGDPVSELKADEETTSECYNTSSPTKKEDCIDQEVADGDKYCCLFDIETFKKKKVKVCRGLTEFQYDHIKLYVKEKMDELLYRELNIRCDSFILKKSKFFFFILLLYLLI